MFEKIKRFYELGLWTNEMVIMAVAKSVITQAQANEILKA